MTCRLVVDLGADGRVSVSSWSDRDLRGGGAGEPSELAWHLDDGALDDLRWYLEDYLRAPFGVYGERGPQVEARLAGWGEAAFAAVFGAGAGRDAYVRMRAQQGDAELVFRSRSPALLGLPWELMRDPSRPTPLALDLAVSRSLPEAELPEAFVSGDRRLRLLMVISRPSGIADVGYRMVARPLLDRLEAVRGQVELVVLRPPTLDALDQVLSAAAAAGEPFQVVHFDGHGVRGGRRAAVPHAPVTFEGPDLEGALIFEKPDGGPEEVSASQVAQVLKAGRVPVVVLNACQSGAVGKELAAAVATRLLQEGIASVVAMAYSVYVVAAAEFMAAFYERLFAGDTVSAAVTAGRRRLFLRNLRPSPRGDMPLADWIVPVHYLHREVSFPLARTERGAGELSLDEALDRLGKRGAAWDGGGGSLDPVGAFVGRDVMFYELEAAARLQHVVVLHGPAGIGKTELAKAFGRWWRDTGGVDDPGWVFVHSFEPGVASFGLDGVITEIGLRLFGSDFAALGADKRRAVVQATLAERRALLIWDNFETVRSMPDRGDAGASLDGAGCRELADFLGQMAGRGRSAVIITSRAREDWLGEIRRVGVGALAPDEAAEYAGNLLAPYPAALPRRGRRAFGDLMEWLDGHPLSMRLNLPHLDAIDAQTLLDGLRGIAVLPGASIDAQRTASLDASIAYSYSHLSADTRRLLAVVSLFQGVADVTVLTTYSKVPGVPERFREASLEDWWTAMEDAVRVGLLTRVDSGMYLIHPALPAYLTALWRTEEPRDYVALRETALQTLLAAYADLGVWAREKMESGDAGHALAVIGLQHRTMGSLLAFALRHGRWEDALAIGQPLDDYWDARGLHEEADAWADRVRLATEDAGGGAPPLDSEAGALWLFFTGAQAGRLQRSRHFDDAELPYRQILAMLLAQPASPEQRRQLAVAHYNLGMIAQGRGRLDDAENLFSTSLAITTELGHRRGMADSYGQLGIVAQHRGRLDDAENWYAKALIINEELDNRPGMATSYHLLGAIDRDRGRLEEAEDRYTKALTIREELGDLSGMAGTYHQLGIIAQDRGRLDDAENWYTEALRIEEASGDRPGMGATYHQLGIIAQDRGRLDDAENWYTRSLAINEPLGIRPRVAAAYNQFGNIAYLRGRLEDAEDWHTRSLTIKEELDDRPGLASIYHSLGVVAHDRGRLEAAEDWYTRSLAANEELGNRDGMARALGMLGLLAEERGQPRRALEQMIRLVTLFGDFPDPASAPGPECLALLTAELGILTIEACWQEITDCPLPEAVRDYLDSSQSGDT
ncbi:MAG TPA: tetratricopeptide repeat protein [Streptosporangiaceae bacterium]|nr:tetratricopeptide repeat protein [Streptosporangiaceae bacterium]